MSLLTLVLQVALVLAVARSMGLLFRRLGQPQVVGEMAAGIVLGPSVLGWAAPALWQQLFPPGSLDALEPLSQIGVLVFMFLVGLELDPALLRGRGRIALVTSQVSIAVPFALGALLALHLHDRYAGPGVAPLPFAAFVGAAMSVTAFPVLARILLEGNLLHTRVGAIAIACAALGDVAAWVILAAVLTLARADAAHPLGRTLAGVAAYAAAMVVLAPPALRRLEARYRQRGRLGQDLLGLVLVAVMASAWITEWLGVHALFGAFLLGALMPRGSDLVRELSEKLQDLTVVLLLPLFFAVTGLRTQIGLVQGTAMWIDCALVVAVAVAGKLGGSALAARAMGLAWREAGAIGALMNTRGLIELVFLTIGLEIGLLSPPLFAMMVLMALVTTFATTPLLQWIHPPERIRRDALGAAEPSGAGGVLVPVSLPSSGPELLRLASALVAPGRGRIYALHLERAAEQAMLDPGRLADPDPERDALGPLLAAAAARGVEVRPLAFVSRDLAGDVAAVARGKGLDLVLMGWHKPVLSQSILGGTVLSVMRRVRGDVAVYVPRHERSWRRVLVPWVGERHDEAALALALRLAAGGADLRVLHLRDPAHPTPAPRLPPGAARERIALDAVDTDTPIDAALAEARRGYDLVVLGASEPLGLEPSPFGLRHERIARECPASLVVVSRAPGAAR